MKFRRIVTLACEHTFEFRTKHRPKAKYRCHVCKADVKATNIKDEVK